MKTRLTAGIVIALGVLAAVVGVSTSYGAKAGPITLTMWSYDNQDPGLEPGVIRERVGETLLDDAAQQVEHLAERVDVRGEIAVVACAAVLGQQPPQLAAARRCGSGRHGLASVDKCYLRVS